MTKPSYEERTFPIQRGTPIPWPLAEVAYRTYAARHSGQSLERLAERGGFGWHEFLHLYFGDIAWKLTNAEVEERWKADKEQQLTTELARVRGLLQHVVHSVIFFVEGFPANDCSHTRQRASHLVDELGDARRELSRPSGAESADIGKLDTADEKDEGIFGDCPVCNCLAKGREE